MSKQEKHSNPKHYYLNRNLEILKGEIWKDIKDFEGLYEVVNFHRFNIYLIKFSVYWLGRRSGYRKGQLDMYKEREKE